MSVKTSVIICAYNYARFLPRCLESVLSQSQPADEIIVVDDGSADETPGVVSRFPSVRYIRQNRAGKAEAFNRGFRESQGDFICHLDADDYWLPRKLERVIETLARYTAGGILHEAVYVDGEDNTSTGVRSPRNGVPRRVASRFRMCCSCVSSTGRRTRFPAASGYPTRSA